MKCSKCGFEIDSIKEDVGIHTKEGKVLHTCIACGNFVYEYF